MIAHMLAEPLFETFMTDVEALNKSLELRAKGLITDPGEPFEMATKKELDGLLESGVFEFVKRTEKMKRDRIKIFKSRLVKTIKGLETIAPYEKSRLVIQGFNDQQKAMILTQSPTIQRASQRLMFSLFPTLAKYGMVCFSRDIKQAYIRSKSYLVRDIFCWPSPEAAKAYNLGPDDIIHVVKPLYGIAEAGNHWYETWTNYIQGTFGLRPSAFDPCLLITENGRKPFAIAGTQVDDTLFIGDGDFVELEDEELQKSGFPADPISRLSTSDTLVFNGLRISYDGTRVHIHPNGQGKKIKLLDPGNVDKALYVQQRALGSWMSSSAQPQHACSLAQAAQHQNPDKHDTEALNQTLKEQQKYLDSGLDYVELTLDATLKVHVYVDGSHANNKDYSSQIGFVIVICNEEWNEDARCYKIRGNIVHWCSVKCKRITRAVLASELYAMSLGIDIAIPLSQTINQVAERLSLEIIPLVVCTDSRSLYECLVKLGTTKEKRLMIDIMAIREDYERRSIDEIRWIYGKDNPADAMTKTNPCAALKELLRKNELTVRLEGWVER